MGRALAVRSSTATRLLPRWPGRLKQQGRAACSKECLQSVLQAWAPLLTSGAAITCSRKQLPKGSPRQQHLLPHLLLPLCRASRRQVRSGRSRNHLHSASPTQIPCPLLLATPCPVSRRHMYRGGGWQLLGWGMRLQGRPDRQTSLLLSRRSRCLPTGDAVWTSSKQQQLENASSSRAFIMTREVLVHGDPACTCTP